MAIKPPNKTIVIDNFSTKGVTRFNNGKLNSGYYKYLTSYGCDVFVRPGQLTWGEAPVQIDPNATVITDLVVAGKERVESGIVYVYCVGHTGRVYKIQVNNPSSFNPNYDNPVLLATLATNSPTFTRGGSIDFFDSTGRIYIGHDKGVTRLNFDGTGETFVGVLGSWTQNVPRPFRQYLGKLYIGNGNNIAEIDSTATVTTYTKLTPGLPSDCQVRDLDIATDGTYLLMVVTQLALTDITSTTADSGSIANQDSYVFRWNGTDGSYTSFDVFSSCSLTANFVFGSHQFVFGYDTTGCSIFEGLEKVLSPVYSTSPLPNAMGTASNLIGWITPEYLGGVLRASQFLYGKLDNDFNTLWQRAHSFAATGTETDVVRVPFATLVSNLGLGSSSNGYVAGIFGLPKYYFSTLETSSAPTTKYKFYRSAPTTTGFGTAVQGQYETQVELFAKKIDISQVRIYGQPWIAGNSFKIDLIGSDNNPIPNSSYTFTAGSTLTVGNDFAWYSPNCKPTFALGVRITQLGTTNHTISKIEIDYDEIGGQ